MNIQRMRELRDHLAHLRDTGHERNFEMEVFFAYLDDDACIDSEYTSAAQEDLEQLTRFDCSTTACMAGWACALWAGEYPSDYVFDIEGDARQILELDYSEARYLFHAEWRNVGTHIHDVTIDDAIEQIDGMIALNS